MWKQIRLKKIIICYENFKEKKNNLTLIIRTYKSRKNNNVSHKSSFLNKSQIQFSNIKKNIFHYGIHERRRIILSFTKTKKIYWKINKIHISLYSISIRTFTQLKLYLQRFKTRKCFTRLKWLRKINRFWLSQIH